MTGKLLIVDDVATNRIVLRTRLADSLHETIMATDGRSALQAVRDDRPDLVLLDLDLPDLAGTEVLSRLRADPASRDLPVIVVTAQTGTAARMAAFAAAADDVLPKPPDPALLLARIRTLLRRRDEAATVTLPGLDDAATRYDWPGLVTLTTFTPGAAAALVDRIAPALPHNLEVRERPALLAPAGPDRTAPDALLIDATGHEGAAMALLSELRSTAASRTAGIAILAPDARLAALAYDLGADEVLPPDATGSEIALRIDALLRRARNAAERRAALHDHVRLALTDPLTGLHNRRYALRRLAELSGAAVETGQHFAVLLADLDLFKRVNDRHGHIAGDAVLTEVAQRLRAQMSEGDLLARIGGEEFLIALPATSPPEAVARARRICDSVGHSPVCLPDGRSISVTLSIGLAHGAPGSLPDALIAAADNALLSAKTGGRNRVIVSRSAA